MDHKHRTQKQKIGEENVGFCRGVIHKDANQFEGKAYKFFRRLGLHNYINYGDFLINLGQYINNPPIKNKLVHPNSKYKARTIKKSEYNLVIKYYFELYPQRKKLPSLPKPRKIPANDKWPEYKVTKDWEEYIEKAKQLHEERRK